MYRNNTQSSGEWEREACDEFPTLAKTVILERNNDATLLETTKKALNDANGRTKNIERLFAKESPTQVYASDTTELASNNGLGTAC